MTTIVIDGDSDGLLTRTIMDTCERYGGILTADSGMIRQRGEYPDFLMMRVPALSLMDCQGILVCGEVIGHTSPPLILRHTITIADTQQKEVMRLLQRTNCPVIGCSMSDKDTLTLSERNETGCLVCVRRTLTALNGQTIEPCEIPVAVGAEIPVFPILATCGVLLLCGIPCEKGYVITQD